MMNAFVQENILDLVDEFQSVDSVSLDTILDFRCNFQKALEEEKGKLPYRLNLLDEVKVHSGIDENAHSRILAGLLSYHSDGQYVVLRSFLQHLGHPFDTLTISKPTITSERERIDVRIRDKDYTIIIENKINDAIDQPAQIERYIEHEKNKRPLQQIYVLYLTYWGGSPNKESLSGSTKKSLGERYKEISYEHNIRPWLQGGEKQEEKETMHALLSETDTLLVSGITQYLDYIEGLLDRRKGEEAMNNTMKELVKKRLGLDDHKGLKKRLQTVEDVLEYTTNLQKYLEKFKTEFTEFIDKTVIEELDGTQVCEAKISFIPAEESGCKCKELQWKPPKWKQDCLVAFGFKHPGWQWVFIGHIPKDVLKEIKKITKSKLKWMESYDWEDDYCWCYLRNTETGYDEYDPDTIVNSIKRVIKTIHDSKELEACMQLHTP